MIKSFLLASLLLAAGFIGAILFGEKVTSQAVASEEHKHKAATPTTVSLNDVLKVKDTDIILGNIDAPITMYEFASLSCSHCAEFHLNTLPKIDDKYIKTGKVRLVIREFPLNPPALKAAQLTRCVDKTQYHKFNKVLFSMQAKWAFTANYLSDIEKIARVGGVTEEEFAACMANKEIETILLENRKSAEAALKIEATPTFYFVSEVRGDIQPARISGSSNIEIFSKLIDEMIGEE